MVRSADWRPLEQLLGERQSTGERARVLVARAHMSTWLREVLAAVAEGENEGGNGNEGEDGEGVDALD